VYKAGYRSTRRFSVTPSALVTGIVSVDELPELEVVELCARTGDIIVLSRAREDTNAVVHDADDKGKRAIVEMVELVYVEGRKRDRERPSAVPWIFQPEQEVENTSSWRGGRMVTRALSTLRPAFAVDQAPNVSRRKTLR
jgi:hypothetical protein